MAKETSPGKASSSNSKSGIRERSAALCVKDEKENEILLVSSKRHPTKWVVPGGGVEVGEERIDAATREVMEEAGVKGTIVRHIGIFEDERAKNRTSVFVLRVMEEMDDWEDARLFGRKRCWFPVDKARELLGEHKRWQQAYIDSMRLPIQSKSVPILNGPPENTDRTAKSGIVL